MASAAGKKGKKPKAKSMSLQSFLANNSEGLQEGYSIVTAKRNWAAEVEKELEDDDYMDPVYSGRDQYILPSAPMGANIDLSKVPTNPPFTAFLGNLPYEIEEDEIRALFKDLKILSIRLPRGEGDSGRPRGFGYVEFQDQQSLIEALGKTDSNLRTGRIKIDVAASQDGQTRRRDNRGDRPDRPDRSAELSSDWRSSPREDMATRGGSDERGGFGGREDRYGDRMPSNRESRFGGRGGFDQDQSRTGGFGGSRGFSDRPDRNRSDEFSRSDFGSDRPKEDFISSSDRGRSNDFSRSDFGSDRSRDDLSGSKGGGGRDDYGRSDRGSRSDYGKFDRGTRNDFNRQDRSGRDDYSNFERGNRSSGFSGGRRDFGAGFVRTGGGGADDRQSDYARVRNYEKDGYDRSGGNVENEPGDREPQDPDQENPEQDSEDSAPKTQVRPTLVLQKRTKPLNESVDEPQAPSAIFGGARPVDTAARERAIEEKLAKEQELSRDRDLRREVVRERTASVEDNPPVRRSSGARLPDGVRSPRTSTSTQPSESGGSHHEEEDQEPATAAPERETIVSETKSAQRSLIQPLMMPKRPEATPAPLPTENAWSKRSGAAVVVAPPPFSSSSSEDKHRNSEGVDSSIKYSEEEQRNYQATHQQSQNRRDEDTNGVARDDGARSGSLGSRGGRGAGLRKVSGVSIGRGGSHVASASRIRDSDSKTSQNRKEVPKSEESTPQVCTSANKFSDLQSETLDD